MEQPVVQHAPSSSGKVAAEGSTTAASSSSSAATSDHEPRSVAAAHHSKGGGAGGGSDGSSGTAASGEDGKGGSSSGTRSGSAGRRGSVGDGEGGDGGSTSSMNPNEMEERLIQMFVTFSAFGASRTPTSPTVGGSQEALIDSARFVKFFKDLGLLGKGLTVTDLDILFSKAKVWAHRTDRKLDYNAFVYALQQAAVQKYGISSTEESELQKALQRLVAEACRANTGPIARGTVPVVDSDGKSKKVSASAHSLNQGTRSVSSYQLDSSTNAGPNVRASTKGLASSKALSSSQSRLSTSGGLSASGSKPSGSGTTSSSSSGPKQGESMSGGGGGLGSPDYTPTVPAIPKGSVFDRLTNHKGYTGTHKERFDAATGKGRGIKGRSQDDIGTKPLEALTRRG